MKTCLTPLAALALFAVLASLGQAQELEAPDDAPLGLAAAQKKVYLSLIHIYEPTRPL